MVAVVAVVVVVVVVVVVCCSSLCRVTAMETHLVDVL